MKNKQIEQEVRFMLQLKQLSMECLMHAFLNRKDFPRDFDLGKAIKTLDRMIDAEIEYMHENPEDYLDIYN